MEIKIGGFEINIPAKWVGHLFGSENDLKICPKCLLRIPKAAERCDCGYDFQKQAESRMEGKTTEELLAIYEGDEESGESIEAAGSILRKRGKAIPSRAKLRLKRILYSLIGAVFSIIMFTKINSFLERDLSLKREVFSGLSLVGGIFTVWWAITSYLHRKPIKVNDTEVNPEDDALSYYAAIGLILLVGLVFIIVSIWSVYDPDAIKME